MCTNQQGLENLRSTQEETYAQTLIRLKDLVLEKNRLLKLVYDKEMAEARNKGRFSPKLLENNLERLVLQRKKWIRDLDLLQRKVNHYREREHFLTKLLEKKDEQMRTNHDEIKHLEVRNKELESNIVDLTRKAGDQDYTKLFAETQKPSNLESIPLPSTCDNTIQDKSMAIDRSAAILTELLHLKSEYASLLEQKMGALETKVKPNHRWCAALLAIVCALLVYSLPGSHPPAVPM